LIGAPPGYVGYEEGGYLTEAVRRRPYAVLLLDEVEKAHPDVFNILLQVLDDGRLTDGHGRTVDFRNTVIVMTSNLGSDRIQELMQEGAMDNAQYDRVKTAVMQVVTRHFRPEFINRIDEVVVFHPLQQAQVRGIADIQVGLLGKRLEDMDLHLQLDTDVLDKLSSLGFDPVYGARPLKRAIQQWLENPLANQVLSGNYPPGSTILVQMDGDQITFARKQV
jgi:ATP-dependent Clp protease ATP-binding subunit ClpB